MVGRGSIVSGPVVDLLRSFAEEDPSLHIRREGTVGGIATTREEEDGEKCQPCNADADRNPHVLLFLRPNRPTGTIVPDPHHSRCQHGPATPGWWNGRHGGLKIH